MGNVQCRHRFSEVAADFPAVPGDEGEILRYPEAFRRQEIDGGNRRDAVVDEYRPRFSGTRQRRQFPADFPAVSVEIASRGRGGKPFRTDAVLPVQSCESFFVAAVLVEPPGRCCREPALRSPHAALCRLAHLDVTRRRRNAIVWRNAAGLRLIPWP